MSPAPETPMRALRLASGLSLREVARRSGINPGRLSVIERGVSPTEDEARHILTALRQSTTCPDCGYHGGQHGEDCHADEWTESELRAAAGDR